jgi:hypothetical protein
MLGVNDDQHICARWTECTHSSRLGVVRIVRMGWQAGNLSTCRWSVFHTANLLQTGKVNKYMHINSSFCFISTQQTLESHSHFTVYSTCILENTTTKAFLEYNTPSAPRSHTHTHIHTHTVYDFTCLTLFITPRQILNKTKACFFIAINS